MRTLLTLALSLLIVGCAGPSSEKMEQNITRTIQQNERFHDAKRLVEVHDQAFVGTEHPISLNRKQARPAFLRDRITLIEPSQNLASLVQRLASMLPCQIHVAPIPGGKGGSGGNQGGNNPDTNFADPTGINSSLTMRVNYSGTVEGLLNTIAGRFGLEWEYNAENKRIEFFKVKTKNFVLLMSPGKIKVETEITNESSISGTTNSGESSNEANVQGKQAIKRDSDINPWQTTLLSVRSMLSPFGSATINESVSTLTVTDMPSILDKVEEYVKEINRKMGRQAAITLTVYSVMVNNESSVNFDIAATLKSSGFELISTAGSGIAPMAGASMITGTIVKEASDWKGTNAILQALSQWGKTSIMQRQNILTLHQKTVPVQVVRSQGYVASSSTTATTNAGNTASLEPGSVTTGFSMQITPNILSNNSLILSYALTLSSLEELTTYKLGSESETTSMIQTPTIASRSFTQDVALKQGSMLVLSGFEMETENVDKGAGILSFGRKAQKDRQLIVITIEVDSVKGAGEILDVTL